MQPLKWLESVFFSGRILKDYGELGTTSKGLLFRQSKRVLLCNRQGDYRLVIRVTARFLFLFGITYVEIPLSSADALIEAIRSAKLADEFDQYRVKSPGGGSEHFKGAH